MENIEMFPKATRELAEKKSSTCSTEYRSLAKFQQNGISGGSPG
ncbi:MAG: hypothetical protein Q8O62_02235 [Aequorivita sp.]|nr:hypothetical protein [Aequorivita sp.]